MKKLHFEILIDAPAEKVWDAVVDDAKYREWTTAFSPGSFFEGGWNKGDTIRFLAIDDNGEKGGMLSEIAESKKYTFISIRHRGFIQNGVEDTTSEEIKKWMPAYENYTFTETDGSTLFKVDVDTTEEYSAMFSDTWPKALEILKTVAER